MSRNNNLLPCVQFENPDQTGARGIGSPPVVFLRFPFNAVCQYNGRLIIVVRVECVRSKV